MFPPQTSMWGRWSPNKERTVLMGVSNAIAYLGNLASNILTGFYLVFMIHKLTYFITSYNLRKTRLAMGLLYLWYYWNYLGNWLDSVFQKFTSWDALDRSERTSIHWVGLRLGFFETLFESDTHRFKILFTSVVLSSARDSSLAKIHLRILQLISRIYHGVLYWHQAGINGPLRPPVGHGRRNFDYLTKVHFGQPMLPDFRLQ